MAEARKRYTLGLKLYEDGNYEAARIEFERAMSLAPSYRILYNIGLAYKQLNNYVDALEAFERYLSEGGAEIAADRRAEVEKEIAELRPRIGQVTVTSNVPGTEVSVDGQPVGKTPLAKPVIVNPGLRRFSFQAKGYFPKSQTITVGSSDNPTVSVTLQQLPKTLVVKEESNPWVLPTVIGWSATGAAAIASGIFGVLSLNAKSDQEDKLQQVGVTADELSQARDKTQTLSGVTDALFITTAVFAGASAFFTIKMITHDDSEEPEKATQAAKGTFNVRVSPMGVGAFGTF